jgi:GPH family glycoside/pentoside/hexuronide:cation symporter
MMGDLGCNMSFALKGTMALFWTQVMGLSAWYSLLLIVVQVWGAINDPLIGSIIDADKRKYKRNKFLAYIWAGSIGLIVGGACCFLPFPNAPTWAKAIIFIAGYVVWDAFYTVANVPYGSLLSLISNDVKDRASLSAWRSVGSIFGNMLPMVILPFIMYDENDNLIESDTDNLDTCVCTWTPKWTGEFKIKVKNLGKKSLDEVINKLASLGLDLRKEED